MNVAVPILVGLTVVVAQPNAPKPAGTMVDIGGQRLHVHCTGSGAPAVVLENGLGDVSVIWGLVQSALSRTTRVCSYIAADMRNRRAFQADLTALSRKGRLIYAPNAGHNVHVEDPGLVVRSVQELVASIRARHSR